ncbi:unnamed protein product [Periconia digitata]|uniref:SnoaL-like domain-containing protein n=1 Tax=Periconia digitata TaxID=1303443 RepID=A0A9W4UM43_9PLEO|nr:unnamed protein product [Periconia digitata]
MRFIAVIFAAAAASLSQAMAYDDSIQPELYESIHQAENILAETLDTKNYERLGESMTEDVVYDSRPLGPDYGGLSVGLAQTTANIKAAFGDALVAHHVSNAIIKPQPDGQAANVTTYIVWSRWDPAALSDPKKSFRIYERCDDFFVVDDGKWKLQYSLVTQLGPKPESPYFVEP